MNGGKLGDQMTSTVPQSYVIPHFNKRKIQLVAKELFCDRSHYASNTFWGWGLASPASDTLLAKACRRWLHEDPNNDQNLHYVLLQVCCTQMLTS
jgi:hypothetical protein